MRPLQRIGTLRLERYSFLIILTDSKLNKRRRERMKVKNESKEK